MCTSIYYFGFFLGEQVFPGHDGGCLRPAYGGDLLFHRCAVAAWGWHQEYFRALWEKNCGSILTIPPQTPPVYLSSFASLPRTLGVVKNYCWGATCVGSADISFSRFWTTSCCTAEDFDSPTYSSPWHLLIQKDSQISANISVMYRVRLSPRTESTLQKLLYCLHPGAQQQNRIRRRRFSFTVVLRRLFPPPSDFFFYDGSATKRKVKNVSENQFGDKLGRIHLGRQDLSSMKVG